MQHATPIKLLWISMVLVCFASCTGTEVGNPQDGDESEVTVQLQGLDRTASGALTLTSGVEIDEAWLVLDRLAFRTGRECDEIVAPDDTFINAVELTEGKEYPGYDMAILPAQSYCRFMMDLHPPSSEELPAGVPHRLEGHSIFVRGKTPEGIPFEIRHRASDLLEFNGRFTLRPSTQSLFAIFELNRWFGPNQLDDAHHGDGDTLEISEDSQSDLLDDFLEALEDSGILVRDENDDGVLQDPELDSPLARGDALRIGDDD